MTAIVAAAVLLLCTVKTNFAAAENATEVSSTRGKRYTG